MRHRLVLTGVDLCLIGLATLCAQILRDNIETRPEQLLALLPYVGLTGAIAVPVLSAFGLNKSVWRLSAMPDYLRASIATLVIVTAAVVVGFLVNRLEGVARSLPILQAALVLFALVGVRVVSRLRYAGRDGRQAMPQSLSLPYASDRAEAILLVGVNRITDLYLRASAEFSNGRIRVVGLLATKERHTGRVVHGYSILGTTEEVSRIVRDLEVHGVCTDRIVVTVAFEALPARARSALLDVERNSNIKVEFFADNIGVVGRPAVPISTTPHEDRITELALDLVSKQPTSRAYWRVKRALDVLAVTTAVVLLAPLIVLILTLVAIDVGFPAIFWQQRPGKDGRPFRLYKFRTMRDPHDSEGRRVADAERLSFVGNLLRRSRLDELPQLYNVLIGEMSFVGPRPLLPQDQFPGLTARLTIRPGLTGWAQVKGGRDLTPSDKAALDVWYVRNGSFRVDLEIIFGTLRLILFGERTDWDAIRSAWRELGCDRLEQPQRAAYERVDHARRPLSNGAMGEKEEHGSTALVLR